MKLKTISKALTFTVCFAYLLFMLTYSSAIIGALAHEVIHKSYSYDPKVIEVNYDMSGVFKGATFTHSHEWVYLNGNIIMVVLIIIGVFCLEIVWNFKYNCISPVPGEPTEYKLVKK